MSEADLIRLLNEDRANLRAEVAASHEESRTLAIQLTRRQKEVAELRADRDRLRSTDHIKALAAERDGYRLRSEETEAELKRLRESSERWERVSSETQAQLFREAQRADAWQRRAEAAAARIEAALDYFESAWERVEPGELRRILRGE